MASLKSLAKDTAIYGMSSIIGRFLNYLLVPLYTHVIAAANGGYGVVTNLYAFVALVLVILTFGMETTFFRFANKEGENYHTVFSTAMAVIATLVTVFLSGIFIFSDEIAQTIGQGGHAEYMQIMAVCVAIDALQAIPFSFLRFRQQAIKFATLKMLFIILNIGLNILFFVTMGKTDVYYVFFLNLVCTSFITLFFIPEFIHIRWKVDFKLLRRMLSYSWPILILGIAGILNQAFDKIIFLWAYTYTGVHSSAEATVELGIYGACVKIAMIMAMITQAFRYAYEPIVFAKSKDRDSKEYYAQAMKYFIIFTLFAFLCVIGYMDLLKNIIGTDYHAGLRTVPIVMAAEIMMGIYFNLSFWYKLIDRTIWGAWFSLVGCSVLIAVNIYFIPRYGYIACAWAGFAGYATSMTLSYIVGQAKNPINYPMKSIFLYFFLAGLFFVAMQFVPQEWNIFLRLGVNSLLILIYLLVVVFKENLLHLHKPVSHS